MNNKPGADKVTFEEAKINFPSDWYMIILNEYAEGASDVEIKALIYNWRGTFSNSLWDRWMSEEPEFAETIKMGKIISEAWWMKNGRRNLTNKDFNYTGWYMNMKNRFGWADRQSTDFTTQGKPFTGITHIEVIHKGDENTSK